MVKRKKSTKKLSPLKIGAIAVIGVGGGWLIWKKLLQPYFFKKDDNFLPDGVYDNGQPFGNPLDKSNENQNGSGSGSATGAISSALQNVDIPQKSSKSESAKIDLDKKIKKGDKGDLVYRVQIAINNIARLRGKSYWYDKDKKKNVNFPLPTDPINSEFADRTDSGAKFAFGSYRSSGYVTLRKAREQWARSAGYFNKPFPTELVGVSNYEDLLKIYNLNRVKKAVNDELFN